MNSPRTNRPTIKDVARLANVSSSTVSYILNNSRAARRISEPTRQRVREAVERLGYRSNPLGQALQRGYTNQVTLLIVTWNLASSHSATAMAISQAAARMDLAVSVHVADDDASAEHFVSRHSLQNCGGVLVLWDSPAFQNSALRQLPREGVPVIDLLPGTPDGISVVTGDREDAGFRAMQHLLALGHRAVGMIGDVNTRPKTTLRKLAGYRRALAAAGLPFRPEYVQDVTEFGFEGGQEGMRALLRTCPEITGLFCINDPIALGAMDAARELGRSCPGDISIIGFGDSHEGRHSRPKLTTFALSSNRVAERAIQLIIEQRGSKSFTPSSILIPEELLLRDSTGPCKVVQETLASQAITRAAPSRLVQTE